MAEWYTVDGDTPAEATQAQERLQAAWKDAPLENLETCGMVLDVAQEQVIAYGADGAPEDVVTATLKGLGYDDAQIAAALAALDLPPAAAPPTRFVYAQLQQAKNLWNAGRVDGNGNDGMDGFTFTPRPLDKTIRSIIRPVNGSPDVY